MQLKVEKYGARLSVENGMFKLTDKEHSTTVPADKVKEIMLNKSTSLSAQVVYLAVQHDIDVLFTERSGKPYARIWSNRFGSIASLRKQQLAFATSVAATGWIIDNLTAKCHNQVAVLMSFAAYDATDEHEIAAAIKKINSTAAKYRSCRQLPIGEVAGTLRGLEGTAGRAYFKVVNHLLPAMFKFSGRSAHPALDMFNALLNYAYGILYSKVETALIRAGLDPFLGIMHRDEYNRPVLVYDAIEPFRHFAEYVVIDLAMQRAVFAEFFSVENGAYWLEAPARRILSQAMADYLEETITLQGKKQQRQELIMQAARELAGRIRKYKATDNTTPDDQECES